MYDLLGLSNGFFSSERLFFAFAGNLYAGLANSFFYYMEEILEAHPDWFNKIQINLICTIETSTRQQLRQSKRLSNLIQKSGRIPKKIALQFLARSDVLLYFFYPTAIGWIPSKLYEYMLLQKPIFALGQNQEGCALLRKTRLAIIVDPRNKHEIENAMNNYVRRRKTIDQQIIPNLAFINKFDRRIQTAKLCRYLDACIKT